MFIQSQKSGRLLSTIVASEKVNTYESDGKDVYVTLGYKDSYVKIGTYESSEQAQFVRNELIRAVHNFPQKQLYQLKLGVLPAFKMPDIAEATKLQSEEVASKTKKEDAKDDKTEE